MSDILIRGMEMPEHCGYCRFRYDGICHALQKTQYSMDECPLVPVPTHGDLIDRDALMKGEGRYIISFGKEGIDVAEINRAPTIIPASE